MITISKTDAQALALAIKMLESCYSVHLTTRQANTIRRATLVKNKLLRKLIKN